MTEINAGKLVRDVTQSDMEAARKFIADEWPSWGHDSQTVSAQLMVLLSNYRIAALEEAAKVAETNYAGHGWHPAARNAGLGIAEAIRKLGDRL